MNFMINIFIFLILSVLTRKKNQNIFLKTQKQIKYIVLNLFLNVVNKHNVPGLKALEMILSLSLKTKYNFNINFFLFFRKKMINNIKIC